MFTITLNDDDVAFIELALEHFHREWVLHQSLNRALERASTKSRVVTLRRNEIFCVLSELEKDLLVFQPTTHSLELKLDDVPQVLAAQWAEHHHVIHPVQEFRAEVTAQFF